MATYKATQAQRELRTLIASDATHVMAFGGSRSGKTFEFCRALCLMSIVCGGRYAIFRKHMHTARTAVFKDTLRSVMRLCFPGVQCVFNESDSMLWFPSTNGEIWCLGLDDEQRVEKILGKEFAWVFFNECSEISLHAVETALTRVSQRPNGMRRNKVFYDCNPPGKSHWAYRFFVEKVHPETREPLLRPELYAAMRINPGDNAANLPPEYIANTLETLSEQKRRRFLLGEWSDDNEGALWKATTMIDPFRVHQPPDDLERIVVAVDPAVTHTERSDSTGIVVAGRRTGDDGTPHFYVLDDLTLKGSPGEWAERVNQAYQRWRADKVVAEGNQGGQMVAETLYSVDPLLPVRIVHARHGKTVRAEPVAALYQRGMVHHCGQLPDLEDEMTSYTGADREKSPDRMDAMVYAMLELMEENVVQKGLYF